MATLTILTGPKAGVFFELKDRPILIGRETFCDIIISSRTVSRQHARVAPTLEGWRIEDLGSVNGTYVNGERVHGSRFLNDHDRIRIYTVDLGYHLGAPESGVSVLADPPSETIVALPREDEDDSSSRIVCAIDVRNRHIEQVESNAQQKLKAFLEIIESIRNSLDIDSILHRILDAMFRIFPQARHGYIFRSDATNQCLPWATRHREENDRATDTLGPVGSEIVDRVLREQHAFLTRDAADDSRLTDLRHSIHIDERLSSAICAPLSLPGLPPLGVIHLESEDPLHPFNELDLELLASVAVLAAQAVELGQVHESLIDYERRKHELAMARKVQLRFLPSHRPEPHGYRFVDHYAPAGSVAGDYYDYIELPDGRIAFTIGDVAGKGASAALMTARLYSDVRYCILTSDCPADALTALNRLWRRCVEDSVFFTMLLCVLDPQRHEMTFARAGHPPPIIRRAETGRVTELAPHCGGLPIGALPEYHYDQTVAKLEPGDVVFCYTDGVSDSMNPREQIFGVRAICEALSRGGESAASMLEFLLAQLKEFTSEARQTDDICIVALHRVE